MIRGRFEGDEMKFLVVVVLLYLDRLRMAKLDLNVNPADDPTEERRRQLTLSFQADAIKAASIIKTPTVVVTDRAK